MQTDLTPEDRRKRFYAEANSENCEENKYWMLGTEDFYFLEKEIQLP